MKSLNTEFISVRIKYSCKYEEIIFLHSSNEINHWRLERINNYTEQECNTNIKWHSIILIKTKLNQMKTNEIKTQKYIV